MTAQTVSITRKNDPLITFIEDGEIFIQSRNFFKQKRKECLIVSFLFDPSTRVLSQQAFTNFVVDEDCGREWNCRQPPGGLQRVHPQALVHPGSVGEEGGQTGLEDQAEVEEVILHSLLEH